MSFELCFFFADIGDPWWKTAVTEMLRSAKRVMPEARIVQLSPDGTAMHPWAHEIVYCKLGPDAKNVANLISKMKGYMVAQHVLHSDAPCVFTDADVIWTAAPKIHAGGSIGFDHTANALPYRQFYVQTAPGMAMPWAGVPNLMEELPQSTWPADAFELALNIVADRAGAEAPAGLSAAETQTFVHHFPGVQNRETMIGFARKLDGGQPFKEMSPTYEPPKPEMGPLGPLTEVSLNEMILGNPQEKLTIGAV